MTISEVARKYLGQKELTGNVFKDDTELGRKLHEAGQHDGDPWCALLGEVCAKEAFPRHFNLLDSLFSASAVQTYKNFVKAGFKVSVLPVANSIGVMQHHINGVPGWQGHLFIVENPLEAGRKFHTIEGNSNNNGSREGIEVAEHDRYLDYGVMNGLRLLGFIVLDEEGFGPHAPAPSLPTSSGQAEERRANGPIPSSVLRT